MNQDARRLIQIQLQNLGIHPDNASDFIDRYNRSENMDRFLRGGNLSRTPSRHDGGSDNATPSQQLMNKQPKQISGLPSMSQRLREKADKDFSELQKSQPIPKIDEKPSIATPDASKDLDEVAQNRARQAQARGVSERDNDTINTPKFQQELLKQTTGPRPNSHPYKTRNPQTDIVNPRGRLSGEPGQLGGRNLVGGPGRNLAPRSAPSTVRAASNIGQIPREQGLSPTRRNEQMDLENAINRGRGGMSGAGRWEKKRRVNRYIDAYSTAPPFLKSTQNMVKNSKTPFLKSTQNIVNDSRKPKSNSVKFAKLRRIHRYLKDQYNKVNRYEDKIFPEIGKPSPPIVGEPEPQNRFNPNKDATSALKHMPTLEPTITNGKRHSFIPPSGNELKRPGYAPMPARTGHPKQAIEDIPQKEITTASRNPREISRRFARLRGIHRYLKDQHDNDFDHDKYCSKKCACKYEGKENERFLRGFNASDPEDCGHRSTDGYFSPGNNCPCGNPSKGKDESGHCKEAATSYVPKYNQAKTEELGNKDKAHRRRRVSAGENEKNLQKIAQLDSKMGRRFKDHHARNKKLYDSLSPREKYSLLIAGAREADNPGIEELLDKHTKKFPDYDANRTTRALVNLGISSIRNNRLAINQGRLIKGKRKPEESAQGKALQQQAQAAPKKAAPANAPIKTERPSKPKAIPKTATEAEVKDKSGGKGKSEGKSKGEEAKPKLFNPKAAKRNLGGHALPSAEEIAQASKELEAPKAKAKGKSKAAPKSAPKAATPKVAPKAAPKESKPFNVNKEAARAKKIARQLEGKGREKIASQIRGERAGQQETNEAGEPKRVAPAPISKDPAQGINQIYNQVKQKTEGRFSPRDVWKSLDNEQREYAIKSINPGKLSPKNAKTYNYYKNHPPKAGANADFDRLIPNLIQNVVRLSSKRKVTRFRRYLKDVYRAIRGA